MGEKAGMTGRLEIEAKSDHDAIEEDLLAQCACFHRHHSPYASSHHYCIISQQKAAHAWIVGLPI